MIRPWNLRGERPHCTQGSSPSRSSRPAKLNAEYESLVKIAAFFYHDAPRWPDILRANAFLVTDPDLIYPRQVLIIPQ